MTHLREYWAMLWPVYLGYIDKVANFIVDAAWRICIDARLRKMMKGE